jgi:hypothetical protein
MHSYAGEIGVIEQVLLRKNPFSLPRKKKAIIKFHDLQGLAVKTDENAPCTCSKFEFVRIFSRSASSHPCIAVKPVEFQYYHLQVDSFPAQQLKYDPRLALNRLEYVITLAF